MLIRWLLLLGLLCRLALSHSVYHHEREERSPSSSTDSQSRFMLHDWLTNEQTQQIKNMEAEGQSLTAIRDKILQFYRSLPKEKKDEWDIKYKDHCVEWIQEVANAKEVDEIKSLKDAGNLEKLNEKINEYKSRLSQPKREMVDLWQEECGKLHGEHRTSGGDRRKRLTTDQYKHWIWWMSDQQKSELEQMREDGKSYKQIHETMNDHFNKLDGSIKKQIVLNYTQKCKEYFSAIATDADKSSLNGALNAHNYEQFIEIMKHIIEQQQSEETRSQAQKLFMICQEVSEKMHTRPKRDIDALMEKHLSWLSDEQKNEIKQMKSSGQSLNAIKAKLLEYVKNEGVHSAKKTYESCYAWLHEVTSADERAELERLHETDHNACKSKVREYIRRLPNKKQIEVNKDLDICEEIWYGSHKHQHQTHQSHQMHHMHHHHYQNHRRLKRSDAVDEYIEKHFQWLNESQRAELHKMHADGKSRAEMLNKAFEFYESIDGEPKKVASKQLRDACGDAMKKIIGEEHFDEIVKMRDSGAKFEELAAKVDKFVEEVTDEEKKAKAKLYKPVCRLIMKGILEGEHDHDEHHGHTLDDYFKTSLKWLSESQRDELKKLKEENKTKVELQQKIVDYYKHLEGEQKHAATEQMIGGCRKVLRDAIGHEHMDYLRVMVQFGANVELIRKKMKEMVDALGDKKAKQHVEEYKPLCGELLESFIDHLRQSKHSLEHYLASSMSWMSESQREHLKDLMENGTAKAELKALVFEYYQKLNGTKKQCATGMLKKACDRLLEHVIGCERMSEIRHLWEAHANFDEIKAKVEHEVGEVTDSLKKEKIKEYGDGCRTVYRNWAHDERERRLSTRHSLSQYFQTTLSWMDKSQMDEIRKMKHEMITKIFSFYDGLTGLKKMTATRAMRGACNMLVKSLIGRKHFDELKNMKHSGADIEQLKSKLDEYVHEANFSAKEDLLAEYGDGCKKIFKNAFEYDQHDAKLLNQSFNGTLKWLNDQQKMHILKLYHGDRTNDEIQSQIIDYLDGLSGDTKASVIEDLHNACNAKIKDIVGDENYEILKKMHESDASNDELKQRLEEMVEKINDEEKKQKAEKFGKLCRHVIRLVHSDAAEKKKREKRDEDDDEKNLKKYFESFLSWLSAEQRAQLLKMKHDGSTKDSMRKVVFEHYEKLGDPEKKHATKLLADGCKHVLTDVIGAEKMEQLNQLRSAGSNFEQLSAKVKEMLDEISDPAKREKIDGYRSGCEQILRRSFEEGHHHAHDLEHYFSSHLSWLSDEQKQELRTMQKEKVARQAMQEKIMHYFESAQPDLKKVALDKLSEGCNRMTVHVLGKENSAVLKEMRDRGESLDNLIGKFNELLAKVSDHSKRESANMYKALCTKVYKQKISDSTAAIATAA